MGWLTWHMRHTSFVQEIANPYAPDLSVSIKPGHEY